MRAYERFLQYVTVDTASDPHNPEGHPSSQKQFDLAHKLADEMRALGLEEVRVSEHCYVYGFLPASPGCEDAPALGLVAHMDTSPDASGAGVTPVLHPNYDGKDVTLPSGRVIGVATFPQLKKLVGRTLITASGDTLLGADDKAGIAEILTACEELLCGGAPHGRLCIAFTPDEEIGQGTARFDVEGFGAQYAYTLDGGDESEIEYETFNAAAARLRFTGVSVHPGSAKGIMVNAARLAVEFDGLLPQDARPDKTEDREGFFHLTGISGAVAEAESEYIIRDHDREKFEAKKQAMRDAAEALNQKYGPGSVALQLSDSYYNMGEVIEQHFHLVENARQAIRAAGLAPQSPAVRGGTDGSTLSFMGLPCPNLGTGGYYFHGPNECITAEGMDNAVRILLGIIDIYARQKQNP